MRGVVRRVSGPELLRRAEGVLHVYADAFGTDRRPHEEAAGLRYLERLAGDVARPEFVAAMALDGDTLLGFATGWTTPDVFPSGRCYPQVAAGLGSDRADAWLCGGREIDELAVHSTARGRGLGAALLDAVSADAPDGRCWLLTTVLDTAVTKVKMEGGRSLPGAQAFLLHDT